MIPALIWVQVAGHEVLREASSVVEEVPAEVQEKDLLIVGVGANTITNGQVQPAERVILG